MKNILLVALMAFILPPVFAQTDDKTQEMIDRMTPDERTEYYMTQYKLFQQKVDQVYKPAVRNAIKISLDVLEGVGQLPKGTEFVGQEANRRNVFNYTEYSSYSIDDAKLEIIFFRNFSGVGGAVQITYSGKGAMRENNLRIAWIHGELSDILIDYYRASNVSYSTTPLSEDADVSGIISPINSRSSYRFTLMHRERSGYVRLFFESIGF